MDGATIPGDAVRNENAGNNVIGTSKTNSNKKRKAVREAQRKHGTPTSIPGNNQQGKPGTPRHQIKPGDLTNKYGQPRLKNGKSKVDY